MPGYRQIHSKVWSSDQWFGELSPTNKLLFIYLFSNERASVSGLYELPLRVMAFETGLSTEQVKAGLEYFGESNKIHYDFDVAVVWVRNMWKYQGSKSPKVVERARKDMDAVPACSLKDKCLHEYTVSIGYGYSIEENGDGIDTSSYSSISSYSSREGEGAGEGTDYPTTPKEAGRHPDIQLYERVTNRFPGVPEYKMIIDTFQALRARFGDLEKHLPPYWSAWSTRKTKDGKPYKQNNPVWYAEWAMNGEIPSANGHEPQKTWTPIPDAEATRKMLEERDKKFKKTATGKSIAELAGRMKKNVK